MDDITQAVAQGRDFSTGARRALLRGAVQQRIFCQYSQKVLDVRSAVLLDGTDYERADGTGRKGGMQVMTADIYDKLIENVGGLDKLEAAFKHKIDVYDGRELFA